MKHSPTCPAQNKEALRGPDGVVRDEVRDVDGRVLGKIVTTCGCAAGGAYRSLARLQARGFDARPRD